MAKRTTAGRGTKRGSGDVATASPGEASASSSSKRTKKTASANKPATKVGAAGLVNFPRAALQRPGELPAGCASVKVVSFNVNGIRALLRNAKPALHAMVTREKPDLLCIQETKLQEQHVEELQADLAIEGYTSHFDCSTTKKGYAGTAIYLRDGSAALRGAAVSFGMGKDAEGHEADAEGRVITVKTERFNVVNLYVPNSGQKLERLDYRVEKWDSLLRDYNRRLTEATGVPTVLVGDLNVAHQALDLFNPDAKHVPKIAGCTPRERASIPPPLEDDNMVDAFRFLYPDASGHFTYWSGRQKGKREANNGLRLDYFLLPRALAGSDAATQPVSLHDTYTLPDVGGSDHCPVALVLRLA